MYKIVCRVCGGIKNVIGSNLTRTVRPLTNSCGCLKPFVNVTHGACVGGKRTGIYKSWAAMLSRVRNPNQANHKYYADVRVTKRWLKFENFLTDVGPVRPQGTTLSRLEDSGMYCKRNCRWHTAEQQRIEQAKKRAKKRLANGFKGEVNGIREGGAKVF